MHILHKIFPFSTVFTLLLSFSLFAQSSETHHLPEVNVSEKLTTKHIRFLASDELLGRMTGEQGNKVAARYIAEYFKMYGLEEPSGAPGYYQRVPLYKQITSQNSFLVINSDTLFHRQSLIPLSGKKGNFSSDVIYIEHLIDEYGVPHPLLESNELEGSIVLTKFGLPTQGGFQQIMQQSVLKREFAGNAGVSALIEIVDGMFAFGGLANFLLQERIQLGSSDDFVQLPHFLADASDGHFNDTEAIRKADVFNGGVRHEDIVSNNVAGIIPGNDPVLSEEFIVLMAHFDHIGAGMRPGISPADTIFNGARDNGMGVVGLLTAAKALSEMPAKRSVLILAVTAEEVGLMGSAYFVNNPLVPLKSVKYVLNVDSGGYNDTSLITMIGHGRTSADHLISESVQAFGLTLLPDPSPEQNLFNRSDNVNFARIGIPAPTFSPGFTAFDEELLKYYHRPADKADENFDFSYLHVFARSYAHTARNLANTDIRLKWSPGDVYEEAFNKLHGIVTD